MKALDSPAADAGPVTPDEYEPVTTSADYEPRRSNRIRIRNPDYKGAAVPDVAASSPASPSQTHPASAPTDNVDAIVDPAVPTEVEKSQPTSAQEPAASSLKRKRSATKETAAPKNASAHKKRTRATAKSTKAKRTTKTNRTTKAKRTTKPPKAAVKNPSKKAAPKNAPIKSEQPSLRFQASDELPHNLGSLSDALATNKAPAGSPDDSDKENRNLTAQNISNRPADPENANADVPTASFEQREEAGDSTATPAKKPRQTRVSYGLTAGKTPYPDWKQPNAAECEEVNRLLSEIHGQVTAPKKIPEPSLTVTGCGEVPSVLDALIRTLLSGATSGTNSALAFDGLVKRFGILSEGIGKGSVNWDAVRRASLEDVFKAIKRGGLAAIKSKNLKAILDQIYDENQERVKELDMDPSADKINPTVSPGKMENEKEYRTACADQHFLSLDHIHKLSTPEAMAALVKYPGIGPKTAACVCLFCLQRPCFAVDTHIFRITKWLGWVPDNANEVTSFSHLEVRIPDHLKYSLHQLFIKHGKTCPRCRAITGEKSVGWEQGCAIEHLVKRTGARKGGPPLGKKKAPRGVKRKNKRKKTAASPSTAKTKRRKASTTVTPQSSARRNPPRNASAKVKVVIESTPTDLEESSTPAPPTTVESSVVKTAPATLSPDQVASSSSPSTPTPKERDRLVPTPLKPRAPRKAQIEKASGKSKAKKNARTSKAKVRGRKTGS